MSINDSIKSGELAFGIREYADSNIPKQYKSRKKQYFEGETSRFVDRYAKYSSDYFLADAQGLDTQNPENWIKVHIRMADAIRPSATITKHMDDYKVLTVRERQYKYVRPGAKFVAMGCTWLVTNPSNISAPIGRGIVQRCNATWNHYDSDGNLLKEPIVVENLRANANESAAQMAALITKGYFNVIAQYNSETAKLHTNSRMILGSAAYRITGFSDFQQEFTGDNSSVRLLGFVVRYEEPNLEIDDMDNRVAGGKVALREIEERHQAEVDEGYNIPQNGILVVTDRDELSAYQTATISANVYSNWQKTDAQVEWDLTGADDNCYQATINGNQLTVLCFDGSSKPLTIKAIASGYEVAKTIKLLGI